MMRKIRMCVCTCDDWIANIDKLLMAEYLCAHGFEYSGELMRYCPWCGTELKIAQDNNQEKLESGWMLIDRWGWGVKEMR